MWVLILPDIWGQGGIFSYSAAYGKCKNSETFSARLLGDKPGLIFNTKNKCSLSVFADGLEDVSFSTVMTDFIDAIFKIDSGEYRVSFIFADCDTVIVTSDYAIELRCDFEKSVNIKKGKKATVYTSESETFAMSSKKKDGILTYAFSYGKNAGDKCTQILEKNPADMVQDKENFYKSLPEIRIPNERIEKLYYRCASVLLSQITSPEGIIKSRYITPTKGTDAPLESFWSAFCTLGLRHIAPEIAKETLESILASQSGDGMISAKICAKSKSSDINPPILAWCFWELYLINGDKTMLSDAYAPLKKYLHYIMETRDINKNHLYEWQIDDSKEFCGQESIMVNSPRFDDGIILDSVDFTSYVANEAYFMNLIAEEIDKHGESLYWNVVFERIKGAINELLFDEDDKIYYDRAVVSGMFKKSKTAASFLPLFAGVCENRNAMALLRLLNNEDKFNLKHGVPTVCADSEDYSDDMFRGPVHMYINYLLSKGLEKYEMHDKANEIKFKSLDAVMKEFENTGVLYEYYSPDGEKLSGNLKKKDSSSQGFFFDSQNVNIRDFAPTAAVIVDILLSKSKKLSAK